LRKKIVGSLFQPQFKYPRALNGADILKKIVEFDYSFGWRWLIPITPSDHVLLLGFTEKEREFWKQTLADVIVTEDASRATICVIYDISPENETEFECEELRSLCVVGSGKVVAAWRRRIAGHYADLQDFALLPSRSPRLVVPFGRGEWIVQGLALHRPGRWIARTAVALMKVLARVGVVGPLRARMIFIANKSVGVLPRGARQAGLEMSSADAPRSFALYLGSPNDNRKTVILPLGGTRKWILKQGDSPSARASLHNEAAALRVMGQTSLASQVPAIVNLVQGDGVVTLYQEYRPRQRNGAASTRQAAVYFLSELSRKDRCARPLIDVLADSGLMTSKKARAAGQAVYAKAREHLDHLATTGAIVWGHRTHGDFAPWNCAWTTKGFFVYDWEESKAWDIALGDAIYFVIAPAVHVARSPAPAAVEADALAMAEGVVADAGLNIDDLGLYMGLWLLQRCRRQANPLYRKLLERLVTTWK